MFLKEQIVVVYDSFIFFWYICLKTIILFNIGIGQKAFVYASELHLFQGSL